MVTFFTCAASMIDMARPMVRQAGLPLMPQQPVSFPASWHRPPRWSRRRPAPSSRPICPYRRSRRRHSWWRRCISPSTSNHCCCRGRESRPWFPGSGNCLPHRRRWDPARCRSRSWRAWSRRRSCCLGRCTRRWPGCNHWRRKAWRCSGRSPTQQLPVPEIPQIPVAHWLLPVQAPTSSCATHAPEVVLQKKPLTQSVSAVQVELQSVPAELQE